MGSISKSFSVITFSLVLALAAAVDAATIRGIVSDSDGEPLYGSNVFLEGTEYRATAAGDGGFLMESIPGGTYTLHVQAIGYKPEVRDVALSGDQTLDVDIVLTVKPVHLDDIVVIRTSLVGNKDRLFGIPGSAHFLGAAELERFESSDIHQVLRAVPGVNIQEEDGYGLRPNIGFRGTGVERSQKITLMEDGILIAPAPYSAPAAYYFPTVGRMSGIEVRKGSSQIKYGPYTTGGALNMISTPIPTELGGKVELLAGEDANRRLHAFVGNSLTNFGFVAETFQENVDGFKRLDGGGNTGFDKKDYMVKFRINTNPGAAVPQQLEFKYSLTDEISNETYLGLTDADFEDDPYRRYAGSQEDVMDADHEQFQLRHFIQPSNSVDITTTFYRNNFHRNWYKLDKVRATAGGDAVGIAGILSSPDTYAAEYDIIAGQTSPNDNALLVKANNRDYYARGIESVVGLKIQDHEAEVGIRYHEDQLDRFQWIDEYKMTNGQMMLTEAGTPGTESNRISDATAWAGFAQVDLTFGALTAVPGLRYESIKLTRDDYGKSDPARLATSLSSRKNDVDVLIPGIGLNYRFSHTLSAFGGVHKGFAPPGSKAGTDPEESISYELGARYNEVRYGFSGVLFFNDYSNLLGSDLAGTGGSGSGDLFNGGEVDVMGLELGASYNFLTGPERSRILIPVWMTYTYTDGTFKSNFESDYGPWGTVEDGDELPYLPKHQFAASTGLEWDRFTLNVTGKYVSKMRTVAGQGEYVEAESIDGHFLMGASANYDIAAAVDLFAVVRNLTDETYIVSHRPAGVRPGLPRTLQVGLRAGF